MKPAATTFDNLLVHSKGPTLLSLVTLWSRGHVITWQSKTLCLNFHETYGYQIWQSGGFWWENIIYKVTKIVDHVVTRRHMINKKKYICISTRPVVTKLGRMVEYTKKPPTQSHMSLQSHQHVTSRRKWKMFYFRLREA